MLWACYQFSSNWKFRFCWNFSTSWMLLAGYQFLLKGSWSCNLIVHSELATYFVLFYLLPIGCYDVATIFCVFKLDFVTFFRSSNFLSRLFWVDLANCHTRLSRYQSNLVGKSGLATNFLFFECSNMSAIKFSQINKDSSATNFNITKRSGLAIHSHQSYPLSPDSS